MSSLRLLVVSLALLAIIGFVACQFEGMGGKHLSPEKRTKLQEVMKKSCEKADIKEEQLQKMKACNRPRSEERRVGKENNKVLGKKANQEDKWKQQCTPVKPDQRKENAKKLTECRAEARKKLKEMS